jgi:hypothetical protein
MHSLENNGCRWSVALTLWLYQASELDLLAPYSFGMFNLGRQLYPGWPISFGDAHCYTLLFLHILIGFFPT